MGISIWGPGVTSICIRPSSAAALRIRAGRSHDASCGGGSFASLYSPGEPFQALGPGGNDPQTPTQVFLPVGRLGERSMVVPSVAAMDLIGPASCSARGRVRGPGAARNAAAPPERLAQVAQDTSWWGLPSSLKVERLIPSGPARAGRPMHSGRGWVRPQGTPKGQYQRTPAEEALRGLAEQRLARGVYEAQDTLCVEAKIATSISSMTVDRRAVASTAPCGCSAGCPEPIYLDQDVTQGVAAPRSRARKEKSPSLRARSRFAMVCSGRTTCGGLPMRIQSSRR